jgi:Holliday junction resolvase RusA-like endonuclease
MTNFVIHGIPQGKGRPRFSKRGDFVAVYTPKMTVDYERYVQNEYFIQCKNHRYDKGIPLAMAIDAYYQIPKSTSKTKALQMVSKDILPLVKPDLDNIVKIICDAPNDVAYHDDSQIVAVVVKKFYSLDARVEVSICEQQ